MPSPCPLCRWPLQTEAVVTALLPACSLRRRLMDFGLVPGAAVCPLFRSPTGNPTAYRIGGTVIALRNTDAADILVIPAESRCIP